MSLELQSLRTMRSPLLEGPAHQRRPPDPWPLILAILALGAAIVIAQRARGATGTGAACDHNADCPPALVCSKGKCAAGGVR